MISIRIVDRKYLVGGKFFRFEKMGRRSIVGYKLALFKYEIRFYTKKSNDFELIK